MDYQIGFIVLECIGLLGVFALVDQAFRRGLWSRVGTKLGASKRAVTLVLAALLVLLSVFWRWPSQPQDASFVALFASIHATMMAWKSGTDDIDIARGKPWWIERILLLACAIGVWWSPAFIPLQLQLVTQPFMGWKHHGSLPLRVLQLAFCWALASGVSAEFSYALSPVSLTICLGMMLGSHYVITAIAKGLLGERWYDWMFSNRLHYVAASSYRWGWARFIPESLWRRVLATQSVLNRPLQIGAWVVEAASPLLLLHPVFAIVLCIVTAVFHLTVFVSTGIFFWEWMVTNLLFAGLIWNLSPETLGAAFGLIPWLLSIVLMLIFPLRGKLWELKPLGWWDTPLTQRVQWRIIGESGEVYDLHNKFMCPHERNYGRVHGCFMIDKPVFTYHLGEVWLHELRDAIWRLRDHPDELEAIRERWGINVFEPEQSQQHARYLKRFFQRLNRGARKHVFPSWLRWMKAPGGQFYYWGDRPSYCGQERVQSVEIWFVEEWWDGEVYHHFDEYMLRRIEVEGGLEEARECEDVDEKVVDAMILQRANGRLVSVPEWLVEQARELYEPKSA